MQRLTVAGRLLITFAILAALYFGFKYIGGKDLLQGLKKTETVTSPSMPDSEASSSVSASSNNNGGSTNSSSSSSSESTSSSARGSFDFTPPAPQAGKLKGVVELGASGFNSFIVKIDQSKNWKLEKAEFGNSMVIENMATDDDIRIGLKRYIAQMLDYGVSGNNVHFVVSSGALKSEVTQKIISVLRSMKYFVNTVTPEQEGKLGLKCVQPSDFSSNSFVVDIGSGNTKISWKDGIAKSVETYGAKYFEKGTDEGTVYNEVKSKANQVPSDKRKTCFIIGGVPSDLAKEVRNGKERYTVLNAPSTYSKLDKAKTKAGVNIYKAVADATGCEKFVFDWDANFTIGFLLDLPY